MADALCDARRLRHLQLCDIFGDRAHNGLVGRALGLWEPDGWPGKEIGWGVAPQFAGKGCAYEGVVATMDFVFDAPCWTEVIHTVDPGNVRSIALTQRLGSTNRGPIQLPDPFQGARFDAWGQSAAQGVIALFGGLKRG